MHFVARLIMIVVLAAFAVSSVAHAAGSARMASEMISAGAEMAGAGCEACDDDTAGTLGVVCDFVCNSAAAAAMVEASAEFGPLAVSSAHRLPIPRDFFGLSSPPAKQPPRFLL
ncbi:MAG: hypothetical protein GY701_04050 [Sulfitobacter sp.]|nr:hypothetical protein [Sulfitobacter sp. NAS-14.1]EAP79053.1 hypothetical protein NAS141_02261 [Sulfitobacter sp. NAS-14.1]MCP3877552.1 hypothetical protein [Sulfitobacter sp.]HBM39694.1 hypothetical protein [Sulfitobacter sp.]